jgi:hypothetical protein
VKKLLVGILIISMLSFTVYKLYKFISRIETSDPEYNTIYTADYNEKVFNKDLIGMTETKVINKLGEPFSKTRLDYFNALIYSNHKDSLYFIENSNSIGLLGYSDSIKYRFLSFDNSGNVKTVITKGYPDMEVSLKKLKKSEIIKILGNPDKEMLCDCNCDVYSYSKIKDGSYSGKHPIINLRNIVFDSNKIAIRIVRKVQNTNSKYDEICTEK